MRIPKHCPSCNDPMALVKVRWICGDSATCGNVVMPTAAELQAELDHINGRRDHICDGAPTRNNIHRMELLDRQSNAIWDAMNYADAPHSIVAAPGDDPVLFVEYDATDKSQYRSERFR